MGAHQSQTLRGSQNVPLHHPPRAPSMCTCPRGWHRQMLPPGARQPPSDTERPVQPAWLAPASASSLGCPEHRGGPAPMVQSWLGLLPPSLLWELSHILPTNAFSAQALICNQDHMDRRRKILTTSGFRKCKRRTKIKHQKQLNQRSDGSENET